jgi:hypothetical protein
VPSTPTTSAPNGSTTPPTSASTSSHTLATLYAQRFCHHRRHQVLVWLGLSLVVTVTTVNLVG